jgi:NitT/TauT family transport system permease protein
MSLFSVNKPLEPRSRQLVTISSFVLPILIWCLVSYVPFIWHPEVEITTPGSVNYFREGMLVDKTVFNAERDKAYAAGKSIPEGIPANPIYLPAPHEVLTAFYTSFTTEPKRSSELWLHESLWSSIQVIFYGFLLSSIIGIPLGVLAGTYDFFSRLFEPFIEFFRYLPAPAFGALAVAILGIYQAPKNCHHFYRYLFSTSTHRSEYHP